MLDTLINELGKGRTLIVLHENADPDAYGSAVALANAFNGVSILAPNGLDRLTKRLDERFRVGILEGAAAVDYDRVLLLDHSDPKLCGFTIIGDMGLLVLDHHTPREAMDGRLTWCDETRRSCAEMVAELLQRAGREPDRDAALLLLTGMLTDTGHFRHADARTLKAAAGLMEAHGLELADVHALLDSTPDDPSMRIAQLKGAQRLKFSEYRGMMLVQTQISSFESSVGKSLLMIGADAAFVGSQKDDELRVSGRASRRLLKRGVHLGRLMDSMGQELDLTGGGHDGAAGIKGKGDVEAVLNILVERVKGELDSLGK